MHYIIGTQLSFTKTPLKVGVTSTTAKTQHLPDGFNYNRVYTLYNIKKTELDEYQNDIRMISG